MLCNVFYIKWKKAKIWYRYNSLGQLMIMSTCFHKYNTTDWLLRRAILTEKVKLLLTLYRPLPPLSNLQPNWNRTLNYNLKKLNSIRNNCTQKIKYVHFLLNILPCIIKFFNIDVEYLTTFSFPHNNSLNTCSFMMLIMVIIYQNFRILLLFLIRSRIRVSY